MPASADAVTISSLLSCCSGPIATGCQRPPDWCRHSDYAGLGRARTFCRCRRALMASRDPTSPGASTSISASQPPTPRTGVPCRGDATMNLDDGVESLERNVHAPGPFSLRDPERFKELLQEHLSRMRWWAMGGQHCITLVVVCAALVNASAPQGGASQERHSYSFHIMTRFPSAVTPSRSSDPRSVPNH